MATAIDISAVPLPPPWNDGLVLLVSRCISDPGTYADAVVAARAVVTALFGKEAPAFGQVARIGVTELKTACGQAGLGADALPVAKLRELAELLPLVRPESPICDECGNFPLSAVGGKVMTLAAGASCPFCVGGKVAVVPMRLRKLAWTDGRLVEPQVTHDLRAFPGTSIPLDDAEIVAWVGGYVSKPLELALRDAGVPLYAWLAHMHLNEKVLPSFVEVADILQDMRSAGLKDDAALRRSVVEAGEFVSSKEVTNLPKRTRLPFIKGNIDLLPRMTVAGRTYVLEGKVGSSDKSDVYRGAWDSPNTERVIIKVSRGGKEDAKRLAREVSTISSLANSKENGAAFLSRLLPEVVVSGSVPGTDGTLKAVTIFRYKNGFDWTLADVLAEYPEGVEPQTMVWMMNRCLLLLRWLQMNKTVHGALVPEHILIHPGYHAATFIGWSGAVRVGGRKSAVIAPLDDSSAAYFPKKAAGSLPALETDVAMLARCMIAVLGGNAATGAVPATVPEQIADFLRTHAQYDDDAGDELFIDGAQLEMEFGKVTSAVYGKRRFHPFFLPRPKR